MNVDEVLSKGSLRAALLHVMEAPQRAERLRRCGEEAMRITAAASVELFLAQTRKQGNHYAYQLVSVHPRSGQCGGTLSFQERDGREAWLTRRWPLVCAPERADGTLPAEQPVTAEGDKVLAYRLGQHDDEVLAVLVLHFPADHVFKSWDAERWVALHLWLCVSALALDNLRQAEEARSMLKAFVKVIARVVDEKSAHTSGHCQRVPLITDMLAQAACEDQGVFRDFSLAAEEREALRIAAWLHDCGKLTTPDAVLDKATKLHALHDRLDGIATRFAVLRADTRAQLRQGLMTAAAAEAEYRQLTDDLAFLQRINAGGEFMSDAEVARVQRMAERRWHDVDGVCRPLLTDEEVGMLCIRRGTLSPAERAVMDNHVQMTLDILESLPFPPHLARVAEYAGGHHERVDGSGFPRGLTGDQLSVPTKILAIADVFEALTANDRPYKPAMSISQALTVLQRLRDLNHIDADLYALFLEARVWELYARKVLRPDQLDVSDVAPYR